MTYSDISKIVLTDYCTFC